MSNKDHAKFSWLDFLKAIWFFYQGQHKQFIFWTGTLFTVFFYQLIPPIIIGKIIDFFNNRRSEDSLSPFFIYVAILGTLHAVVSFIRLTSKNKTAALQAEASYNMRIKGFDKLLDFSLQWHDKENTGNKVLRIQNGLVAAQALHKLLSHTGFSTITAILGIIVIFLLLNPLFVVFLVIYLAVFMSINIGFYKKMQLVQNSFNKAQETAGGSYYEGINNILTIKTLGVKDSFKKSIYSNELISKDFAKKIIFVGITKWKAFQIFNSISMVVYLLMVGHGVVSGTISIGSIFLYYTYLMKLTEAAADSTDIFEQFIQHKSAFSRMMPLYWETNSFTDGIESFPTDWQYIKIKHGNFSYKKDKHNEKIFKITNLNFKIKKYEKIGIAGISGGGKSTLAKLLLGLYELEQGEFTVGNKNFYDIKHEEITKKIGIVLQESEMFNLSLKENITLMKEVKPELLVKAIKISQLENLINKLPDGLETKIGEKGHRISGGERQRIGIARAICKDPEIFVFDEATSALDNKTEALIQQALERELNKKTLIIIAHRITTLKNVDRIAVFEKGSIVEEGTFKDLFKNPTSVFYELSQLHRKEV